jgi:hypothetical protein
MFIDRLREAVQGERFRPFSAGLLAELSMCGVVPCGEGMGEGAGVPRVTSPGAGGAGRTPDPEISARPASPVTGGG